MVLVINTIIFILELVQIVTKTKSYLLDPYNYVDLTYIGAEYVVGIIFFTDSDIESNKDLLSYFIGISSIAIFVKLLILLRVTKLVRHILVVILNVLSDMKGFLFICLVFFLAFSLAIH